MLTEAPAPLNDVSQGALFILQENNLELKKPTTYHKQVDLLKDKGIIINNPEECELFLQQVNYYRFSAYFLPFLNPQTGKCFENVTFERLQQIYYFDQELRVILFSIIEDIEIYARTGIAYYHSHKYGPDGYLDSVNYNNRHKHPDFMQHINNCIRENRKTLVVKHHQAKFDGKFPLWVIVEFFSIGMLSHFYTDLQTEDKKACALFSNILLDFSCAAQNSPKRYIYSYSPAICTALYVKIDAPRRK